MLYKRMPNVPPNHVLILNFFSKLIIARFCSWSALKSWPCLSSFFSFVHSVAEARIANLQNVIQHLFATSASLEGSLNPVFPSFCTLSATFIFPECSSHATESYCWPIRLTITFHISVAIPPSPGPSLTMSFL